MNQQIYEWNYMIEDKSQSMTWKEQMMELMNKRNLTVEDAQERQLGKTGTSIDYLLQNLQLSTYGSYSPQMKCQDVTQRENVIRKKTERATNTIRDY